MTQDVSITVKGLQFAAEGTQETVEVINVGQFSEMNRKIYLKYEEVIEGENEPVQNLFKISDDCIELVRRGPLTTNMIFKKNEKTITYYETPFGGIHLGIFATQVEVERTEKCIEAMTEYGLEMNGEHITNCRVNITVRPLADGVQLIS